MTSAAATLDTGKSRVRVSKLEPCSEYESVASYLRCSTGMRLDNSSYAWTELTCPEEFRRRLDSHRVETGAAVSVVTSAFPGIVFEGRVVAVGE